MSEYKIYGINGPVVTVKGKTDLQMTETVYVGEKQLIGEVIGLSENHATIQVYEETAGLTPGEPVFSSRSPMSVTLGPGIMSNIFDGIERPLESVREISGAFIEKGINIPAVSETKKWTVTVALHEGDKVFGGEILASCPETDSITHKSLVPPNIKGTVTKIVPNGEYTVTDTIAEITDSDGKIHEIKLAQRWPIRVPRPVKERLPLSKPLITGQRIIDTIFPIAKGGAAAIPGGFGTGKTMTQHQLAKWCDADIIIYIGCGERGNEMTQVLSEFSELTDPRTGKSLLSRTVLIANTSNMPVAAREASIYTGITLAEYYRDMG
ncbi:MAG: V-type ATP synthase subunit A, partial [Oscillospiraceae bacterium]|nr:V-type ATP synthase subunit A [Oscillospiraceae bacterium]